MSKDEANERHQLGGGRAQHMAGGRSEKRITEGVVSIWVHRGLGLTGSQSQIALTGSISSCYGLAQLVIPSSFFWSAPQHQTTRPLIIASRNIVVSFAFPPAVAHASHLRPVVGPRRHHPLRPGSPSSLPHMLSAISRHGQLTALTAVCSSVMMQPMCIPPRHPHGNSSSWPFPSAARFSALCRPFSFSTPHDSSTT